MPKPTILDILIQHRALLERARLDLGNDEYAEELRATEAYITQYSAAASPIGDPLLRVAREMEGVVSTLYQERLRRTNLPEGLRRMWTEAFGNCHAVQRFLDSMHVVDQLGGSTCS